MPGSIELPRPWRLLRTAAWSVGEAVGLPAAVCLGVTATAGRAVGLVAGLAAVWLAVVLRKLAWGKVPGLLMITAPLLAVQTALVLTTGQVWIYLLQFPVVKLIMSVLFARSARSAEPLVARLATEVASLRHGGAANPGLHRFFQGDTWLWAGLFGSLAAGFAVVVATKPLEACLMICSAATVAAIGAGVAVSAVWFRVVLARNGLRLRFAPR